MAEKKLGVDEVTEEARQDLDALEEAVGDLEGVILDAEKLNEHLDELDGRVEALPNLHAKAWGIADKLRKKIGIDC